MKFSYAKFRASWAFVWFILTASFSWVGYHEIAWHFFPNLPTWDDRGFPVLTLYLSIEASVQASVILAKQISQSIKDQEWRETQAAFQNAQLERAESHDRHMAHMMEALIELAKRIESDVDEIVDRQEES